MNSLRNEVKQDKVNMGLKTLIIDIENTLITKIEIKSKQELD